MTTTMTTMMMVVAVAQPPTTATPTPPLQTVGRIIDTSPRGLRLAAAQANLGILRLFLQTPMPFAEAVGISGALVVVHTVELVPKA